jgi:hypothetical protein
MSKPTKSRRRQKSPEHNWEIVGEKDNDEFDIRYLREVDFSEVEQLDPSRQDCFKLVKTKTMMMRVELDKTSSKTIGNLFSDEIIVLRVFIQGQQH